MDNKKIPTIFGTILIVIIAITVGVFVWKYEIIINQDDARIKVKTAKSQVDKQENMNNKSAGEFIYNKDSHFSFFISNFGGTMKSSIEAMVGTDNGISFSRDGIIAYADTANNIQVQKDYKSSPQNILSLPQDKYTVRSVTISPDGKKIAYTSVSVDGSDYQLWIMNVDGLDNKVILDDSDIDLKGPDSLIPLEWSMDNAKIYLRTTNDGVASDAFLYGILDVEKKTVQKLPIDIRVIHQDYYAGPYFSFSQDKTKIAFVTFKETDEGLMSNPVPPYALNIIDLNTLAMEKISENQNDLYENPRWSPNGKKISYRIGDKTEILDLETRKSVVSVMPISGWISNDEIVYTETSGGYDKNGEDSYLYSLYSSKIDGAEKKLIDSSSSSNGINIINILK